MESFPLLIGCSELSQYMAKSPYGLTEKEQEKLKVLISKGSKSKVRESLEFKRDFRPQFDLPKGAMSAVKEKVRQYCLDYKTDIETKGMSKGTECEQDAIDFLNFYRKTSYKKNEERKEKKYLKGTCDIIYSKKITPVKKGGLTEILDISNNHIIDIKCPETWKTMPQLESEVIEAGEKSGYFWQGLGYMYLFNGVSFELCYCMRDTPDEYIAPYIKDDSAHKVSFDTDDKYCISSHKIDRDEDKIKFMLERLDECKKYADWYFNQLINK